MAVEDSSPPQPFEFAAVILSLSQPFWVCRSHFEYGTANWQSIAIESLHVYISPLQVEFSTVDFAIIFNDRDTMTDNTDEATVEFSTVKFQW